MARVNTPEVVVVVNDDTERTVCFNMSQSQVYDALFTWLRINKVKLPSDNQDDYSLAFNISNYDKNSGEVRFTYTKKL